MSNRDNVNTGKRNKIKRRRLGGCLLSCLVCVCMILAVLYGVTFYSKTLSEKFFDRLPGSPSSALFSHAPQNSPFLPSGTPDELLTLLEHNKETYDFVMQYPDRETYLGSDIDLSADSDVTEALRDGRVPLLMQWDLRWGYAPYGDDMVGLAGCGPTCLSMAYIYLTKDLSMDPAAMADFAWQQGFYTESGTDWALWTDGASLLGLSGEILPLSESAIKNTLDNGGVVICSMRPGDFTTTGHFILIRDYDEDGFYVNDPNRKSNSDRQWSYDRLSGQIKNLWGIS